MEMPMDLTEVKLRRKDVFEGKIMTVHVDDVRLPNGEEATREVVDHVDGAAVLALDEANRVLVSASTGMYSARCWMSCPRASWTPARTR